MVISRPVIWEMLKEALPDKNIGKKEEKSNNSKKKREKSRFFSQTF